MKAIDEALRVDYRRMRIQPLLHQILHIVSNHLSDDDYRRNAIRELHNELFDKLHEEGVEIVTDHTRAAMGLPPRGPDGWTAEEIMALEKRRLELMLAPIPPIVLRQS
jgi:predicted subunit of tRNA(5-methylaminomethyl-2-thiouridylate) methyltransferase